MRRFMVMIALMICYSGGVVRASGCIPPAGEPLRIGAVFPVDTLFSTAAADGYRGIQALVAAMNACGGLNNQPVELVYQPASNYVEALRAAEAFKGDVPLVIGSGSAVVSEVLAQAAEEGSFFYWEVTEPLDKPHLYALSPRPNNAQLGVQAAIFVQTEVTDLLDEPLRVALVYEDNQVARRIAESVRTTLQQPPLIDQLISEDRSKMAMQMREQRVNVVMVVAFERQADRLWYQLREADANPAVWVQVGGETYRHNMCSRLGNTDGVISISAAGAVNNNYRLMRFPELYQAYESAYAEQYQREPSARADLAASGTLLLREILLRVEGDMTPQAIALAAASATGVDSGLMSESWDLDMGTWINQTAVVVQQQNGVFCTLMPEGAATCEQPLQRLPTWRERARTSDC